MYFRTTGNPSIGEASASAHPNRRIAEAVVDEWSLDQISLDTPPAGTSTKFRPSCKSSSLAKCRSDPRTHTGSPFAWQSAPRTSVRERSGRDSPSCSPTLVSSGSAHPISTAPVLPTSDTGLPAAPIGHHGPNTSEDRTRSRRSALSMTRSSAAD